ncbi:hypothetical protein EIN_192830 [Entamoeba invadens IP1]|uniref:Uncharacterized protein n=1 Tax=Entamoeba invadens IP1 TaxID=370355 RepID=A0A0A1U3K4_ENTIV|nr:hypothetical protein EIN_192830 [Entamoeba invadens IP1]ELP88674.1 hypothetical protein EIN_192830 [Entamoeba invadens IP1]|eukprot:XP_004255445.1 hypothetical protein EIN_192830 [Entamoeba invadens IP1]
MPNLKTLLIDFNSVKNLKDGVISNVPNVRVIYKDNMYEYTECEETPYFEMVMDSVYRVYDELAEEPNTHTVRAYMSTNDDYSNLGNNIAHFPNLKFCEIDVTENYNDFLFASLEDSVQKILQNGKVNVNIIIRVYKGDTERYEYFENIRKQIQNDHVFYTYYASNSVGYPLVLPKNVTPMEICESIYNKGELLTKYYAMSKLRLDIYEKDVSLDVSEMKYLTTFRIDSNEPMNVTLPTSLEDLFVFKNVNITNFNELTQLKFVNEHKKVKGKDALRCYPLSDRYGQTTRCETSD